MVSALSIIPTVTFGLLPASILQTDAQSNDRLSRTRARYAYKLDTRGRSIRSVVQLTAIDFFPYRNFPNVLVYFREHYFWGLPAIATTPHACVLPIFSPPRQLAVV